MAIARAAVPASGDAAAPGAPTPMPFGGGPPAAGAVVLDDVVVGDVVVVLALVAGDVALVLDDVVVEDVPTTIVPVMNGCRSQWNVYVPGESKVHVPLHPGPVGADGSGGTAPGAAGALCVHDVDAGPEPKSALCVLAPLGYPKLTVAPTATATVPPPVPVTCHA